MTGPLELFAIGPCSLSTQVPAHAPADQDLDRIRIVRVGILKQKDRVHNLLHSIFAAPSGGQLECFLIIRCAHHLHGKRPRPGNRGIDMDVRVGT